MMRSTRLLLIFCTLALFLAACANDEEETPPANGATDQATPPAPIQPGVSLDDLVAAMMDNAPGETVLARLDEPKIRTAEARENRHDPSKTDTLRTLHYDGLDIILHEAAGSDKTFITSIVVREEGYETGQGLKVGSTRAEVERLLGRPAEDRASTYVYNLSDDGPTPNQLRLRLRDDVVQRMQWDFYVD